MSDDFFAQARQAKDSRLLLAFVITVTTLMTACLSTSVYKFQSQPTEASVYYVNGTEKSLIGVTPIDYAKTALPGDAPFTLIFEKPGYETREISVSPTDNSRTTIRTTLKASREPSEDVSTKRVREVIRKVFEIQELTSRQRFVDALAAVNKLEEAEPKVAEVYALKGSIYLILNDPTQTKAQWEKALKIDPTLDYLRERIKKLAIPGKAVQR
jgi:tetratricopeptide (TPR) repeat protein